MKGLARQDEFINADAIAVIVGEQLLKRQDLVALVQTSLARIRMMDLRIVPPWR